MPRSENRTRTCQNCDREYELGIDSTLHKYCSIPCRQKWHYRRWRSNGGRRDKRKQQDYWLRSKYGITADQRDEMLVAQGGCCAICNTSEPSGYNWHVDHNHETGEVRGLLCSKCNQGIGLFDESTVNLESAIDYLRRHNGKY